MPVPSPRNPIRPARGNYADLLANIDVLDPGEICYATDQNTLYVKEGSSLVETGVSQGTIISNTEPTQRPGGGALVDGDVWYNPSNDGYSIYYSSAWNEISGVIDSVNGQTGVVVLDADDIDDTSTTHKFATAAQLAAADSATQPGDNVSTLTNDAGYITSEQAPGTDLAYNSTTRVISSSTGSDATLPEAVASGDSGLITGTDKAKLDGIAAGAEVNVQSDWNAASGDAQILNKPTLGTAAATDATDYATAAQGGLADSATQPGDNVSTLANDAGYITLAEVPADAVSSVNAQTGVVVLDADDIDDASTTHKFATAAQLAAADSATQPGDNVSTLTNDANYIDAAGAPVQSVAGKTGAVSLVKADVGLANVDNTSDANKPISTATQSALDLKADLVGGVIPNSQLPSLAISEYLGTVANEAALLALSGQRGDWAIRTDTGSTWVITTDGGSVIGDWTELATPADAVSSVNGFTGAVVLGAGDVGAATAAQGATADSATQPGDNVSTLTNDAGYITLAQVPADAVSSVNTQTGAVVLDADDIDDTSTAHKFATAAQLSAADSATQPGDNVSTLTNDAGYITLGEVPADAVSSVNTQTGAVVLDADDINDTSTAHKFATAAQLSAADSATQPGDNVSTLTNDAGYITDAGVTSIVAGANVTIDPVGGTGAVTINSTDTTYWSRSGTTLSTATAGDSVDIGSGAILTTVTDGDIDLDANGAGLIMVTEYNLAQLPIVTQNDIGTGPNEIPLNGYLGTMAYQQSDSPTMGKLIVSEGVLVADLGTGVLGTLARVTDATSPAVGSTVTGGGSDPALVWYNGTNWNVLGV